MSDTVVLLVLPAATLLFSAALLVYALRGRRVDDHPVCRKCGFDLIGKPADSRRCSECGAELNRRRAVRIGRREARRAVVWLALPVLLLSAGWLGLRGWREASEGGWNRHKPVWWLVREVESRDAATRRGAWAELLGRLAKGALSDEQAATLTERALAYQADAGRTWDTAWGHWVERAEAADRLKPGQWERYLDQGLGASYRLVARARVRRGDPLPMRLDHAPRRLGPTPRFTVMSDSADVRLLAADGRVLVNAGSPVHKRSGFAKDYGLREFKVELTEDRLAALPDGPLVARLSVTGPIYDLNPTAPGRVVPGVLRRQLDAPWTLVPADESTVKLRTDPALRPAVLAALALHYVEYRGDRGDLCAGILSRAPPPVPLAFTALLRDASRSRIYKLSPGVLPDPFNRDYEARSPASDFAADRVDLVLRPDVAQAAETADFHEIWGEEVVIENIRVRPPSAPPPARR